METQLHGCFVGSAALHTFLNRGTALLATGALKKEQARIVEAVLGEVAQWLKVGLRHRECKRGLKMESEWTKSFGLDTTQQMRYASARNGRYVRANGAPPGAHMTLETV